MRRSLPWLAILVVTATSAQGQTPVAPLDSLSITVREGTTLAVDRAAIVAGGSESR